VKKETIRNPYWLMLFPLTINLHPNRNLGSAIEFLE
jgi:hypothetical protein